MSFTSTRKGPFVKAALLAVVVAGIGAGFAAAQDVTPLNFNERSALYITPEGTVKMMRLNDTGHGVVMKHAKPVGAGTVIYRSGNRFYTLEDRKMEDGSMLFSPMSNWINPGN